MAQPRHNDFLVPTLGVVFDAIAVEAAFLVSYFVRFETTLLRFLPLQEDIPPLDAYIYGSLVVIPIWLLLFKARKMYGARRNVALADEFSVIVRLVTLGMLIVMSGAFFYRAFSYSRVVFGLLWITAIGFTFAGRVVLALVEKSLYKRGKELRNAVIIGTGETANRIYGILRDQPLLGYRFVGYFAQQPSPDNFPLAAAPYLGQLEQVPQKLSTEQVELALIALSHEEYGQLFELVQMCEGVNVEFMMVPDILEIMASQMRVVELEGIPFIKLKGVPMTTWGRIIKRAFDAVVCTILLILFSPILLLIAILIKLDSKGPVFFSQERVGLDSRQFSILKFRSMKIGAEARTGPLWATENDPRRTRVGKFLRQTSLDELPQLVNVLKGNMSLVGPRPERQFFVEQFKQFVPKYLDRHRVKAGMTGWAQVNGLRGPHGSLEERIKYDIYYVENWSLWFDIRILLKTIRAVFSNKPRQPVDQLTN